MNSKRAGWDELPLPWKLVAHHNVGGLTEVGFSPDERYLLVVSHSGRGLVEVNSGLRIARDPEIPWIRSPWRDEPARKMRGIGPASGIQFSVAGLWGGSIPSTTHDGWSVAAKGSGKDEEIWLSCKGNVREWFLDDAFTEVRALGFSQTGNLLVVAISSDLWLIARS